MRKILAPLIVGVALIVSALPAHAATDGSLIKASGPAVYYLNAGKRYVFPNERIFFSWYRDFSTVETITDRELASYQLGGNVTFRPGVSMVKLPSDPKVYVVAPGGVLRPIDSETVARGLFGANWSRQVNDLSEAYFLDYKVGAPVVATTDFDQAAASAITAIDDDFASRGAVTPVVTQKFTAVALGAWSDLKTWGGKARPTAGSEVVIPTGVKVILDDTAVVPELKSLEVQGELSFWNGSRETIRLAARSITVSGNLNAGTSAQPWQVNRAAELDLTGPAGLTVASGGVAELAGVAADPAWTTLAEPAKKGESSLVLSKPANGWQAGSRVLVASTSRDARESEVRAITRVSGSTLTLDKPLSYGHSADAFLKTEVAPLDRNVTVVGTNGAAIVVQNGGRLKLTDVALRGLPITYDRVNDASGSVLNRLVLEGSLGRCLTARAANRLTVADSVFYQTKDSCLVGETGSETGLVLRRNLIVDVAAATGAVPAGILLRNPSATVEGNAVAGSAGMGYWYLTSEATRTTPLGGFTGNSVHGALKSGLYVDDLDGRADYAPSSKAIFSGLRAVQSGDYGFWARGSGLEVSSAFLGDNRVGGAFAAFGATFKDSVVQGDPDSASSTLASQVGFAFQDGPVNVSGVTFRKLLSTPKRTFSAFGWREKNPYLTETLNAYRNVTLEDAQAWQAAAPTTVAERMAVVRDLDAGKSVTPKSDFLDFGCASAPGGVQVCPGAYVQLQVTLREATSSRNVALARLDGRGIIRLDPGEAFNGTYAYFTVAEGEAYRFVAPDANRLAFSYPGRTKPLEVKLAVGSGYRVTSTVGSTWSYDAGSGELDLKIAPGDYVDVQW